MRLLDFGQLHQSATITLCRFLMNSVGVEDILNSPVNAEASHESLPTTELVEHMREVIKLLQEQKV